MAQQIKKKYLDQEVISYFDDQISSVVSDLAQEVVNRTSDVSDEETRALAAESALSSSISGVQSSLTQEIADRIADVDAEESRAMSVESSLQSQINTLSSSSSSSVAAEEARAMAAEAALDGRIDVLEADPTTKTYVDGQISGVQSQINNILSNVDPASLDSFTEVVSAFQAADASLNGAITSLASSASTNLANEVTRATAAEGLLDGRLDVLEAVQWYKEKFVVNSTIVSNGFVTLSHSPKSNSMSAFVDRLAIHEGVSEDYSISGTTMTFLNDLVGVGNQKLQVGDTIFVKYMA